MSKICEVLRESPPLRPSNAAVDLLLAVGRLQVCSLVSKHTTAALQRRCSFCKCQLAASRSNHTHQSVPHCEASFRDTTHSSLQCAGLSGDVRHIAGSWRARLPGRPRHLLTTHCVLDRQHSGATTALLLYTTALGHRCCHVNAFANSTGEHAQLETSVYRLAQDTLCKTCLQLEQEDPLSDRSGVCPEFPPDAGNPSPQKRPGAHGCPPTAPKAGPLLPADALMMCAMQCGLGQPLPCSSPIC